MILLQAIENTGSTVDILTDLAKLSPLIAILVAIIIYSFYKMEKKEKEISILNMYIRDNDKENLQVLNNVNNTLDKVIESQRSLHVNVSKENTDLKNEIIRSIENLKVTLKEYIDIRVGK